MRDQLKHLEGQLVVLQGRVAKARITDDRRYFFCVSQPELAPWDGNESLGNVRAKPQAKLDHIWVQTSADQCNWPQLYTKQFLVGTCGYYCRKDGSVDLSVTDTARILNGEKVMYEIEAVLRSKRPEAERIDGALKLISYLAASLLKHGTQKDGEDYYVYANSKSVFDLTEELISVRDDVLKRQQQMVLQSVHHLKPVAQKPGSMLFLNQPTAPKHQSALDALLKGQ